MSYTAHGQPLVVDTFLRPLLGGARWLLGLFAGALLFWMEWYLWVPLPLLVATALVEAVLLVRSDRPIALSVSEDRIVVDDRFAATLTVRVGDVRTCVVLERARAGGTEVVVVLGGERRPLLAVAFQLDEAPQVGVDVEAVDVHLQAQAGLLRATAPATRAIRQRFHDRRALEALLSVVPDEAKRRIGLRLWRGAAPTLSVFGHHTAEHDLWMLCEDESYQVVDADGAVVHRGRLHVDAVGTAEREAILLQVAGERGADLGRLPLLVVVLDGLQLAIPAPARAGLPPAPFDDLHHTHAPEAAALLARLTPTGPDMPPPWAGDTPPAPQGVHPR